VSAPPHPQRRVAAILTCYNEGRYIGDAVRSVLNQTCVDAIDQIVIADDGSAADTLEVLEDIERWDSRILVLYGPGGAGLPAQRNLAISRTTAPFIAILDGDDWWSADKLERQLPVLEANPDLGLVYSGYFMFGSDSLQTATPGPVLDITSRPDLTLAYFLNDPPIIPSTTLLRRSAYTACGGFDAAVRVFEDTDFYLRLSRHCRFAFVDAPVLYKRSRGTSITGGRRDLMAHHAFVALKAAADDPRLLALVPRRLAERARKLGNVRMVLGDEVEAKRLLRFATRLDPSNLRAWMSVAALTPMGAPLRRVMASRMRSLRAALGSS